MPGTRKTTKTSLSLIVPFSYRNLVGEQSERHHETTDGDGERVGDDARMHEVLEHDLTTSSHIQEPVTRQHAKIYETVSK